MLISESHKFIFIHVPKVAGMSISNYFKPYALMNRLPDGRNVSQHSSARQLIALLGQENFRRYFIFGFVRNPWDRVVSLYHYIIKSPGHEKHERVKAYGGFDEFVKMEIPRFRPMQKGLFLDETGEPAVDFIGRFETLTEDIQFVCEKAGIEFKVLPHVNKTSHVDYRDYYNETTKRIVNECCSEDIRFFGYHFDGLAGKEEN